MDVERELARLVGKGAEGRVLVSAVLRQSRRAWHITGVELDTNGRVVASGYEPHGRYGRSDRGLFKVDADFFCRAAAILKDQVVLEAVHAGKWLHEVPDDLD
jgi:hypothetical protein